MYILTSKNELVNLSKLSIIFIDDNRTAPDDPGSISEYILIGCCDLDRTDPAHFITLEAFNDDEYDEAEDALFWLADAIDEDIDDNVIYLGWYADKLRKAHRTGSDLFPKIKGRPAVKVPDKLR